MFKHSFVVLVDTAGKIAPYLLCRQRQSSTHHGPLEALFIYTVWGFWLTSLLWGHKDRQLKYPSMKHKTAAAQVAIKHPLDKILI